MGGNENPRRERGVRWLIILVGLICRSSAKEGDKLRRGEKTTMAKGKDAST